jgi:hypothetical protein
MYSTTNPHIVLPRPAAYALNLNSNPESIPRMFRFAMLYHMYHVYYFAVKAKRKPPVFIPEARKTVTSLNHKPFSK